MALYSIFQDALSASSRDVGQEMLHATLLLSCVFVGWCASSALVSAFGWFQKYPDGGKAKEGSSIFREEVAAYVQANTIQNATKHFGLSHAEIQNCVDAVEQNQRKASHSKVGQICQAVQEIVLKCTTLLGRSPSQAVEADREPIEADSEPEDEDAFMLSFSVAPSLHPGLKLLEQYNVFGAPSGMWSGSDSEPEDEDVCMWSGSDSEPEDEDVCMLSFSIAPSLHPGLILLEQYNVFGAPSGMWSGSVQRRRLRPNVQRLAAKEVEDASKQNSCCTPSTHSGAEDGSYAGLEREPQTFQENDSSWRNSHDMAAKVWVPLESSW